MELVNFDDNDHLEDSSSTPVDADLGMDIEEEKGEHNNNGGDLDDFDYAMQVGKL